MDRIIDYGSLYHQVPRRKKGRLWKFEFKHRIKYMKYSEILVRTETKKEAIDLIHDYVDRVVDETYEVKHYDHGVVYVDESDGIRKQVCEDCSRFKACAIKRRERFRWTDSCDHPFLNTPWSNNVILEAL